MAEFDLVIRGGRVATASETFDADIGVRGGRIAALGSGLGRGAREIDAAGRWVLPGGIDSHCHIAQLSSSGVMTADDFATGSTSAACGGTTTIIPFAAQHRGNSLRQVVQEYHARADGRSLVDYAFHLIVSDPTEQVLGQELPALIRDGYTSFKIYTTYDALKLSDRQVLDVMALARREGAMMMVHAENHDIIAWLSEKLVQAGRRQPSSHAIAHHPIAESEATNRVIALAELLDVPVLFVHVSAKEAIDQIRAAQARGLKIYGETCPQYLFLTADMMDAPGDEGAKCMCSPPPRDKANQEFVWQGLRGGVFEVFSSDHAPYRFEGPDGKKAGMAAGGFKKVPNGIPGLEIRLASLFSAGVLNDIISINQFVALTATNHAKMYGLYPRKGTIAVGADADICIWDGTTERTITQSELHDAMDYTPYEGMKVRGWPVVVLSRGEVVSQDGKPVGRLGRGEFLRCEKPDPARPRGRWPFNVEVQTILG
ncbi:MAG: dihydropyrimidinase [Alphaproteobacteria bacterium]|nr:dihydropyrimidinase [Alphaproteobacteria bacterium]